MTDLLTTGLCLAGSACIVRALAWWIGSGRAQLHDLSRPGFDVDGEWHPAVCPLTRERRNDLSVQHYLAVSERGGHRVRAARVVPEPAQLHGWEDDGGTPA